MSKAILFHLAVNNGRGLCSGQIAQIQLGRDESVTLEAMWWDEERGDFGGPAFEYHFTTYPNWSRRRGWATVHECRGHIQIERRRFPFVGYHPNVGNMCWDVVAIPFKDALRLLRWLRRKRLFDCTEAPGEFFDLWRARGEITPSHLRSL